LLASLLVFVSCANLSTHSPTQLAFPPRSLREPVRSSERRTPPWWMCPALLSPNPRMPRPWPCLPPSYPRPPARGCLSPFPTCIVVPSPFRSSFPESLGLMPARHRHPPAPPLRHSIPSFPESLGLMPARHRHPPAPPPRHSIPYQAHTRALTALPPSLPVPACLPARVPACLKSMETTRPALLSG